MNRLRLLGSGLGLLALCILAACGSSEVENACSEATPCAEGQQCVDGKCAPGSSDAGSDAGADAQDGPDTALPGQCSADGDCGERACQIVEGVCARPACVAPGASPDAGDACQWVACEILCGPGQLQDGCDCAPADCEVDADCGGRICREGTCADCSSNEDCPVFGASICSPEGVCVPPPECQTDDECLPFQRCEQELCVSRAACVLDADCPEDHKCVSSTCTYSPLCLDDADCGARSQCIAGQCVAALCRGSEDCPMGELCDAGQCILPPASKSCIIATSGGVIANNQTVVLEAFAFDPNGNGVAATFNWNSSNPPVAALDRSGTRLIGGTQAGSTTVSATIVGDNPVTCQGTLEFTNLGVVAAQTMRVVVINGDNQRPVADALVHLTDGTTVNTVTTDASGVAVLPRPTGTYEVSVFSAPHNYITIQGINSHEIRIPLSPRAGRGPVAGFKGEFDLSAINSTGDITLGVGGASLAGGLIDLDLQRLLGEQFTASVTIPGQGTNSFPIPGGIVTYGRVFGLTFDIKKNYYVNTSGGARLGWGLAGKIPFNRLLQLFQGGGDVGLDNVLVTLLPLFSRFDHALQPLNLTELPRVLDTTDINGNQDTTEWVPNYQGFPQVNMRPSVRQQLATDVVISNFPQLTNGPGQLAVLVGGTVLDSAGFTPMGLSATNDQDGDGRPDARLLYMAPPHGSAVGGRFAILALAINTDDVGPGGVAGGGLPSEFSAALWSGQTLPTTVSLGTFPDATTATIDDAARTISLTASAGPVYRARLAGTDRSWDVWSMGVAGSMGTYNHTITVPRPPAAVRDDIFASGGIVLDSIRTLVLLDDLVKTTGVGLRNAGLVSTSFNRVNLR